MYVSFPTNACLPLDQDAALVEIRPDPAYTPNIYGKTATRTAENAVDNACVFKYFAPSHLNLVLDLEQGLHTAPAPWPTLAQEPGGGRRGSEQDWIRGRRTGCLCFNPVRPKAIWALKQVTNSSYGQG